MNEALVQRVRNRFVEKFGDEPRVYYSPGRINMIGEHVDYNNGFVMPAAVDQGIYYALGPSTAKQGHVIALDFDDELKIDFSDIHRIKGWKNYLLGVLYVLQSKGYMLQGFNGVFAGDLPVGAGMSSSAAVECGLGWGLNELFGWGLDRVETALVGQKAEHSFPGVQCGIMDQFANMMGKRDHVILLDCQSLEYQHVPLQLVDHDIVLINSMVHHSLAGSEYNLRRQQCEAAVRILQEQGVPINSLRDASESIVHANREQLGQEVFEKALFVAMEIARAHEAAGLLKQHDISGFGRLMFETHEGLSRLYKVSCEELDMLVNIARSDESVAGARLMGGGFGGCTINIVAKDHAEDFIEKSTQAFQKRFNIQPHVYRVRPADGTHRIN